ncbi:ATP-binding protein [Flavobacteriaceae bacterium M23B6Z8]
MTDYIHQNLLKFEQFQNIPDDSLEWLGSHLKIKEYEKGDFLFEKGKPIVHMELIFEGEFEVYLVQQGSKKGVGMFRSQDISGVLPFSRLQNAQGYGVATKKSVVAKFPKEKISEMICDHYQLTEVLVHTMNNRIRSFTQQQVQNEKLIALGKLSAGLAHELNNPASAMVRSAEMLQEHLTLLPEGFKAVIKIKTDDESIDFINGLMYEKLKEESASLSLMERTSREDELFDWFENCNLGNPDDLVDLLVAYNFSLDDLELIKSKLREEDFYPVLNWIVQNITTQKTVAEIREASQRIENLIKSIKSYSYMDRNMDFQPINIHEGIKNTVTVLNHKIGKVGHEVVFDFEEELPKVQGLPGELNQVWTNIIDNAIDAFPEKNGRLEIKTSHSDRFIIVEFTDNGHGIPKDVQNHIFEPFYTMKEIGQGTGLGLDMVLKILKQHEADIKVTSEHGNTKFRICFPRKELQKNPTKDVKK